MNASYATSKKKKTQKTSHHSWKEKFLCLMLKCMLWGVNEQKNRLCYQGFRSNEPELTFFILERCPSLAHVSPCHHKAMLNVLIKTCILKARVHKQHMLEAHFSKEPGPWPGQGGTQRGGQWHMASAIWRWQCCCPTGLGDPGRGWTHPESVASISSEIERAHTCPVSFLTPLSLRPESGLFFHSGGSIRKTPWSKTL